MKLAVNTVLIFETKRSNSQLKRCQSVERTLRVKWITKCVKAITLDGMNAAKKKNRLDVVQNVKQFWIFQSNQIQFLVSSYGFWIFENCMQIEFVVVVAAEPLFSEYAVTALFTKRFIHLASQKSHHSIQFCSAIMNIHVKLWIIYASASCTWTKRKNCLFFFRPKFSSLKMASATAWKLFIAIRCDDVIRKRDFLLLLLFPWIRMSPFSLCQLILERCKNVHNKYACIQFMYGEANATHDFTLSFTLWNVCDMILA